MSLWIKICGNTSLEDAQWASQAGADALGFIFSPSPRRVLPSQVEVIVPKLPAAVEKIGVFVDSQLEEISETVDACCLTGVQLHSEDGPELPARLRERFGVGLRILRAVHFGAGVVERVHRIHTDPNVDAILVDSRTPTAVGGTGVAFDWVQASKTLFGNTDTSQYRLIAAGGLKPGNVAEAIRTLRPWGVDVSSGVESAPGRKDPRRVQEFIANARAAAHAKFAAQA